MNWPFLHALVHNVGSFVPSIAEALHQQQLNQANMNNASTIPIESPERNNNDFGLAQQDTDINSEEELSLDDEDESDCDSVVDQDSEHINTLVALSGDSTKYFDTERWFRMLLWTIHMYVDGYCSDYAFQYGLPYAPSTESVTAYIDQHDGDPFVLQAPVSAAEALLPHQTAMALLPKPYMYLLPKPLQRRLEDNVTIKRVFPRDDEVDIDEVVRLTNDIPTTEYSNQEHKLLFHGEPFLLRRAHRNELHFVDREFHLSIPKPGARFRDVRKYPVIIRKTIGRTTEPPCYPWPAGGVDHMLQLPYIIVAGHPLQKANEKENLSKNSPNETMGNASNHNPQPSVERKSYSHIANKDTSSINRQQSTKEPFSSVSPKRKISSAADNVAGSSQARTSKRVGKGSRWRGGRRTPNGLRGIGSYSGSGTGNKRTDGSHLNNTRHTNE